MPSDDPNPADQAPLPAVIPAWPIGGRIYGLNKGAWFRATKAGDVKTVTINGRMFLQVAEVEAHVGRKLTCADLKQPPKKPRKPYTRKAAGNPANLRDKIVKGAQS